MEYPWKRFWSLRTGRLIMEPSGFLLDPDGPHGNALNPDVKSFSDINAMPCLVLLGEPGIGKSTAVRRAIRDTTPNHLHFVDLKDHGSEDRFVRTIFEGPWWQAWRQGDTHLTVFFDSLDEGLMRLLHFARVISAGLRDNTDTSQLKRISVRIACRTSRPGP